MKVDKENIEKMIETCANLGLDRDKVRTVLESGIAGNEERMAALKDTVSDEVKKLPLFEVTQALSESEDEMARVGAMHIAVLNERLSIALGGLTNIMRLCAQIVRDKDSALEKFGSDVTDGMMGTAESVGILAAENLDRAGYGAFVVKMLEHDEFTLGDAKGNA